MKHILPTIKPIGILAAIAAAFLAGRQIESEPAESTIQNRAQPRSEQGAGTMVQPSKQHSRSRDAVAGWKTGRDRGAAAVDSGMRQILAATNPVEAQAHCANVLKRLTPENAPIAWDVLVESEVTPDRIGLLNLIGHAWASMDGESAVRAVENAELAIGSDEVMAVTLSAWAEHDPGAAIAWLQGQDDERMAGMSRGVVRGLARSDISTATDFVLDLGDDQIQLAHFREIAEIALREQSADFADTWLSSITDPSLREEALGQVVSVLAEQDLDAAAEWAGERAGNAGAATAMATIGSRLARRALHASGEGDEFRGILRWLETLPQGEPRIAAHREVIGVWAEHDPESTAEYLNQLPSSESRDELIGSYVRAVSYLDPGAAAQWADIIDDQELRALAAREAASYQ